MKNVLLIILSFIVCISCSESDVVHTSGEDYSVIQVRVTVFRLSVTASDGTVHTDRSLRGTVAVIVFLNTDCSDCRKELPQINTAYRALLSNEQVRFIAISRAQNAADVAAYWSKEGLDIPYSAQSDRSVYSMFHARNSPYIYCRSKWQDSFCIF